MRERSGRHSARRQGIGRDGLPVLIVAPAPGRVRVLPPRRFREGREWLEEGQPVLRIEHGRDEEADVILAPMKGTMGGVLRRDGEPVKAGQPVAWMEAGEPQA
jgi:hypothetical protein